MMVCMSVSILLKATSSDLEKHIELQILMSVKTHQLAQVAQSI